MLFYLFRSWIDKSHWTSARFRCVSELRLGYTEEEKCGLKEQLRENLFGYFLLSLGFCILKQLIRTELKSGIGLEDGNAAAVSESSWHFRKKCRTSVVSRNFLIAPGFVGVTE